MEEVAKLFPDSVIVSNYNKIRLDFSTKACYLFNEICTILTKLNILINVKCVFYRKIFIYILFHYLQLLEYCEQSLLSLVNIE